MLVHALRWGHVQLDNFSDTCSFFAGFKYTIRPKRLCTRLSRPHMGLSKRLPRSQKRTIVQNVSVGYFLSLRGWHVFQHDSANVQKVKSITTWFVNAGVEELNWFTQSHNFFSTEYNLDKLKLWPQDFSPHVNVWTHQCFCGWKNTFLQSQSKM